MEETKTSNIEDFIEFYNSTEEFSSFNVSSTRLEDNLIYLKEHLHFYLFLDYFIEEFSDKKEITLILKNPDKEKTLALLTVFSKDDVIKSLGHIYSSIYHYEENILSFDQEFKTTFTKPNKKGDYFLKMNLTKLNPSSEITYSGKEERVEQIFFPNNILNKKNYNRKRNHSLKYLKKLPSRLGASFVETEALYCMAVEDNLTVDVTDKAKVVRMIFLELSRISSHLEYIFKIFAEFGFYHDLNLILEYYNKIETLMQSFAGDPLPRISVIGGIKTDIPFGWVSMVNSTLDILEKDARSFFNRKKNLNNFLTHFPEETYTKEELMGFSITGPNLRSTGINYDLRKSKPYYFYSEVDFNIPLGKNGSSFDRFCIRELEIYQSIKLIKQLANNIPNGSINSNSNFILESMKPKLYEETLSKTYSDYVTYGYTLNDGHYLAQIEGAEGVVGFYMSTNNEGEVLNYFDPFNSKIFFLQETIKNVHIDSLGQLLLSFN